MKTCPFCKKDIIASTEKCPHCNHVLIERSFIHSANQPHVPEQSHAHHAPKQPIFSRLLNSVKSFFHSIKNHRNRPRPVYQPYQSRKEAFKKYIPILALLLLIIFIASRNKASKTVTQNPVVPVVPVANDIHPAPMAAEPAQQLAVLVKDPKDYVSLANGTIFSKNSYYLKGLGQLEIDNGTKSDAIAKLVSTAA
ncbi:MAG: hypothetical protein M1333_02785, partial [Patescibacteria group bacterium]|nr:hypothetical protein [Patescibacteria group bacterium]